jgi:hypothetical protein
MATKKEISDAVLYKLAGGVPDSGFPVDERDIWHALESKVNALFKLTQFSVNLPSGSTIPDGLYLATYEDVAVTRTSNERSKCTLPVIPVSLPRNAGIHEIRPVLNLVSSGDRMLGNPVIPLQAGQDFLLQADSLLNDMLGQFWYIPSGKTITFSKDLTVYEITKVDMKLVVFEAGNYTINQDLPIPADMVQQIEDELVREFAVVMPESAIVNNFSNMGQKPGNAVSNDSNKS